MMDFLKKQKKRLKREIMTPNYNHCTGHKKLVAKLGELKDLEIGNAYFTTSVLSSLRRYIENALIRT